MKRFARILIATAGLGAASAPAIFAGDFHDYGHDNYRRDRTETVRRDDRFDNRFDHRYDRRVHDRDDRYRRGW